MSTLPVVDFYERLIQPGAELTVTGNGEIVLVSHNSKGQTHDNTLGSVQDPAAAVAILEAMYATFGTQGRSELASVQFNARLGADPSKAGQAVIAEARATVKKATPTPAPASVSKVERTKPPVKKAPAAKTAAPKSKPAPAAATPERKPGTAIGRIIDTIADSPGITLEGLKALSELNDIKDPGRAVRKAIASGEVTKTDEGQFVLAGATIPEDPTQDAFDKFAKVDGMSWSLRMLNAVKVAGPVDRTHLTDVFKAGLKDARKQVSKHLKAGRFDFVGESNNIVLTAEGADYLTERSV